MTYRNLNTKEVSFVEGLLKDTVEWEKYILQLRTAKVINLNVKYCLRFLLQEYKDIKMNETEIRQALLISVQRALWGKIYPSVRAIAVGFEDIRKLKVICYLDREPRDEDYENLGEVTGEVCADIAFKEVEEYCVYSVKPFSQLNSLTSWVYIRKEE